MYTPHQGTREWLVSIVVQEQMPPGWIFPVVSNKFEAIILGRSNVVVT